MKLLTNVTNPLIHWLNSPSRAKPEVPLSDFNQLRREVRPGDVILVEGTTHASQIITAATNSPWTHSALYIGRLHDIEDVATQKQVQRFYEGTPSDQLVLESVLGKGVIITNLEFYKEDHLRICRPQGIAHDDVQRVTQYATGQLGLDYDVRQTFDLLRLLLPWRIMPRRWRSTLFKSPNSKVAKQICSSLIAEAFASVKFPVLPLVRRDTDQGLQFIQRNPKLFTPSNFDYSPYFDIIKYPFLSDKPTYKNIPWHEEGQTLSDDDGNLYHVEGKIKQDTDES